ILTVCALVHISADLPSPTEGFAAVRAAGGVLGYLLGTPLTALVTVWAAVPLLVLLGVFGLLVLTATPVHMIGPRLTAGYRRLTGHRDEQEADDDGPSLADRPTLAQEQEAAGKG